MWEVLNNISTLLTIITSLLISIPGGVIAAMGFLKHKSRTAAQQSARPYNSSSTNNSLDRIGILDDLDIWDKAEAIGQGIFWGGSYGIIAWGVTSMILFALSSGVFLFVALSHPTTVNKATATSTILIIAVITSITGLIVGVLVGVVSGVNESKRKADYKRLFTRRRRLTSYVTPFSLSKAATKLLKAPLLKVTNAEDQVYEVFRREIEKQMHRTPYWGSLIIFTKDNQLGEVVNIIEQYKWEISLGSSTSLIGAKQANIRPYSIYNHQICAAVFKDLMGDKAHVIWMDTKQPAFAVVSPGEATAVDWR